MTQDEEFFTQERMRAIGLGIGKGFQSYDPNNPFAGAGAAMETTIGSEMGIEARKQSRADQVTAQDKEEASKRAAEVRSEERAVRDEDRAIANQKKVQDEQAKRWKDMHFGVFSQGKDSPSAIAERRKNSSWMQDFADAMTGGYPRLKGNSPIEIYEELLAEIKAKPKDEYQPVASRQGGMTYKEATGSQEDKTDVMFDLRKQR
jgi:hypothetical protein